MKRILALAITLAFAMPVTAAEEQPKTKRVCVTTTDAKTKKEVEKCRTVKVHKKHEGNKVPEKAPAKKPAGKPEPKK
jgi:hypothetical protein